MSCVLGIIGYNCAISLFPFVELIITCSSIWKPTVSEYGC